ncbi:MAG: replicative DNA helicase [Desulfobulbaceae bacterium]|nr:replicative DNA helicase [Desulfobulbaceae bacterium]
MNNEKQYYKDNKKNESNAFSVGKKIPPHSLEAEKAVLGAMMIDRLAIPQAVEMLSEESFYQTGHQMIFSTITKLSNTGQTPDIITVTEDLKSRGELEDVGGIAYLSEINHLTPTSAFIEQHARIVQEKYLKRQLINTAREILNSAYDDSTDALDEVDVAERLIFEIAEKRLKKSYMSMNTLLKDAYELISQLSHRDKSKLTGVPSGYSELDHLLGGFQKSDLIIIAARPSMGKTALALSMARNAAVLHKAAVAFFSIEMSSLQLVIRLISSESRVDQQKVRTGSINQEDDQRIVKGLNVLSHAPIYVDDSPMLSILELRAKCRRLKSEHDIQLVFVDYLQLLAAPKAESREREISLISASLKQIAKELNIPVVALAQLNRSVESRTDKRPMLSDLRESGSIEQDADVVMFVNRPEQYGQMHYDDANKTPTQGTAEIIVGKQRNGPVGTIRLAFQKNFARFENLATDSAFPEPENLPSQPDEAF